MQTFYDNLAVEIFENRDIMGAVAATAVAEKIMALHEKQEVVNIIFASAPSQNEFLEALNTAPNVEWARVNSFHMDEYIELPADHPATFRSFLDLKIFSKLPFKSVNYINGNAPSIGEECRRYTNLLTELSPDIVCLGIGENGHLAFNDPALVKMVKLDADSRQQQVNDGCFSSLAVVPAYAISLTIPALMAGKFVYGVVPDSQKANAVYNTLNEEVIERYPSTILRRHPNAILFLDKDSASRL